MSIICYVNILGKVAITASICYIVNLLILVLLKLVTLTACVMKGLKGYVYQLSQ